MAPFDGTVRPLAEQMAQDTETWHSVTERDGLAEPDLHRLASPWHADADLGRPIEAVPTYRKSRRLCFKDYMPTGDAFFALFDRLRSTA